MTSLLLIVEETGIFEHVLFRLNSLAGACTIAINDQCFACRHYIICIRMHLDEIAENIYPFKWMTEILHYHQIESDCIYL